MGNENEGVPLTKDEYAKLIRDSLKGQPKGNLGQRLGEKEVKLNTDVLKNHKGVSGNK